MDKTNISTEKKLKLERALEYSNTMQTFNLAKNNLKVKTQNLLSYSHNGGMFVVDQSLISFMYMIVNTGREEIVILDKNDIPIKIKSTHDFLEDITSLYFEAINEYYNDYEKLRSSRKIEKVLEI